MGKHWVKATAVILRHNLDGAYMKYWPGDWFECRNQEMMDLLARELIETNALDIKQNFDGCDLGVVVRAGTPPEHMFDNYGLKTRRSDAFELPWERTAFWNVKLRLTTASIVMGLIRVDGREEYPAWEMAAMLESKQRMARDFGSEAEQARTLDVLGDLRLPIYETGILWVRRTEATEEVIRLWRAEVDAGADERHAFLRTIYTHRALLCTLPADWIGQWTRG